MVRKPPKVTRKVAGRALKMSAVASPKFRGSPKPRPILKQALMNPAASATAMPLVKLKSFTAAFFSSSDNDEDFM